MLCIPSFLISFAFLCWCSYADKFLRHPFMDQAISATRTTVLVP